MVMNESTHSISSVFLKNVLITAGSAGLLCKLAATLHNCKTELPASQPLQEVWNSYLAYRKWYEIGKACICEHQHLNAQLLDRIQKEWNHTFELLQGRAIFLSQSVYDSLQAYLQLHKLWIEDLLWENENYDQWQEEMEEIALEEQHLMTKLRRG